VDSNSTTSTKFNHNVVDKENIMKKLILALTLLFISSVAFSGEEKPKPEVREKVKPVIEGLQERREQQHKENMEWLEAEINKLDIDEDVKKKILERLKERRAKMREKMEGMKEKHRERRGKK
jgi:predicted RNase H-like nuclease (RuvC/YqgF family)